MARMFSFGHWPSVLETQIAAGETIARRMPILWRAAMWPSVSAYAEARQMVVEKQMAFVEAVFAMHVEFSKLMFQPWWTLRAPLDTAHQFTRSVTAPAARRVKANARRLRGH